MGTSYFTDFQPEELDLVLSMPYRIGVWMSQSDDVAGTNRDDAREGMTLENVLERIENKAGKSSFVTAIISEILDHKEVWGLWNSSTVEVIDDLPRSLALADDRLPRAEAVQYRKCIFQVAKAVAMAANESPSAQEDLSADMFGGKIFAQIADWLAAKSDDAVPENISDTEKKALGHLLQLLKA